MWQLSTHEFRSLSLADDIIVDATNEATFSSVPESIKHVLIVDIFYCVGILTSDHLVSRSSNITADLTRVITVIVTDAPRGLKSTYITAIFGET